MLFHGIKIFLCSGWSWCSSQPHSHNIPKSLANVYTYILFYLCHFEKPQLGHCELLGLEGKARCCLVNSTSVLNATVYQRVIPGSCYGRSCYILSANIGRGLEKFAVYANPLSESLFHTCSQSQNSSVRFPNRFLSPMP